VRIAGLECRPEICANFVESPAQNKSFLTPPKQTPAIGHLRRTVSHSKSAPVPDSHFQIETKGFPSGGKEDPSRGRTWWDVTLFMQTIPEQIVGRTNGALSWPSRIIAKLRNAIETPIGYQDETGFHFGVVFAEKEVQFTSLDCIAASTKQIAIWILIALKEAWERKSSLLTYCTESALFSQIKYAHTIKDADITRGIRFLVERRMIKTVNRKDAGVRFPSLNGLDYLAAYLETEARRLP
jgi:hypothetical protein